MAGLWDPSRGMLLMEVDPQTPMQNAEHSQTQTPVMKIRGATRAFVMHNPSQKTDSTLPKPPSPAARKSPSRSYSRIRWVNSDATSSSEISSTTTPPSYQAPKRRRLEPKQSKRPLLTVKRPIKNAADIHEDAWRLILTFSDPKLLLRMRYVSSMFRNVLMENNIWKESRENHFDEAMPECPFFLTEPQYVDLLVGSGCQNSECLRRETRKAYWIFGGRLCENCLRQRTSTDLHEHDQTPQSLYADLFETRELKEQYGTSIIDLIPSALHEGGKYNAPRRTQPNGKWYLFSLRPRQYLYLKSDYTKIATEFATIRAENWVPERVLEWTKEKYETAVKYAKVAEALMDWEMTRLRSHSQPVSRTQSVQDRKAFFVRKAAELKDPISLELLEYFAAYEAALKTCNQPSDRAWNALWPKIEPFRQEAERVSRYRTMQTRIDLLGKEDELPEDARLFERLHKHRHSVFQENGESTKEQLFVIDLAQVELRRLQQNRVADEDLVLLCLRNVFERFQNLHDREKPIGLNYDGSMGPYKLSLDDARMIVDEVIKPEVDRKTVQSVKVLDSFRCSGCTRANVTRKWSFDDGFDHILRKHSMTVGKDLHYSRYARNHITHNLSMSGSMQRPFRPFHTSRTQFPWYILEWTRNLPLLPAHAQVNKGTKWIPDLDEPYIQQGNPTNQTVTVSVFQNHRAVPQSDIDPTDFCSNFVRVASLFSSTTMDGGTVTRIALRYSLDLVQQTDGSGPTLDQFLDVLPVAQKANLNMTLKYKCGLCSNDPQVNKHLRFAKTPVSTDKLRQHWDSKHAKDDNCDWTTELMDLPDDEQIMATMLQEDARLQKMQEQSSERETIGLLRTVRKVPDQKAKAIMSKTMSLEVFNQLYVPSETESDEVEGGAMDRTGTNGTRLSVDVTIRSGVCEGPGRIAQGDFIDRLVFCACCIFDSSPKDRVLVGGTTAVAAV